MDFKNAIFDMDGTLIDSMSLWRHVQADCIEDIYGVKFSEEEREKLVYLYYKEFVECAGKFKGIEVSCDVIAEESYRRMPEKYINGEISVKPYVLDFLKLLKSKGIGTALATATRKELCVPYLKKSGIYQYLDCIYTTEDDAKEEKHQSSKVYDMALEHLNGTKEDTVVFEDVLICMQTAKNNGYRVYAVADKCQGETVNDIKKICEKFIENYKDLME